NVMTQSVGSWHSFVAPRVLEPAWLDTNNLDVDARRIEVWYANHGFFDAHFLGWELRRIEVAEHRKVRPVVVVGHVEQGLPSKVTSVEITGLDGLLPPLQRRVRKELDLAV